MNTDQKVITYSTVFKQLQKEFKWTNKNVLMAVASMYTMKSKEFQIDTFSHIAASIKSHAGLFSPMKSHLRFTTAAILAVHFEEPIKHVSRIFTIYEELIEAFKRGNYTYMSATIILTNDEQTQLEEFILKAKAVYDTMKKEHPFLTGSSDYPMATLLAYEAHDNTVERMEHFYEQLNVNGFHKGNDLQFLSHILSLAKEEDVNLLINRIIQIYDDFSKVGIKQKSMYYPVMGILGLLLSEEVDMEDVANKYELLNQTKHFKWQKDMNVIMAANFFVSEKMEHSTIAEASIYTAVESIIQAQQAIMIGAMAGGAATASSSSSGGN